MFAGPPAEERHVGGGSELAKRDVAGFEPYAAKVAAFYGDDRDGLADVLDTVAGIQNAYFGTYAGARAASLSDVVQGLSPRVDTAIELAAGRVLATAADLSVPLEEAVASERPQVARTQARLGRQGSFQIGLLVALASALLCAYAAWSRAMPCSRCRTTFSSITTASSTTNPTDSVSAINDRLSRL
jgi:hypothetical protein